MKSSVRSSGWINRQDKWSAGLKHRSLRLCLLKSVTLRRHTGGAVFSGGNDQAGTLGVVSLGTAGEYPDPFAKAMMTREIRRH
jgi:hypothetical protein